MFKTHRFAKIISVIFLFNVFFIYFFWINYPTKTANFLKKSGEYSFLVLHKNDFAVKLLEISKSKNPNDFETYFLLGRVYFIKGQLFESLISFNKAIELNPGYKESYYGRGLTYGFASPIYYPKAILDFQKYIEIDNLESQKSGQHAYGAWAGYNDLAWIYYMSGDFINAEETAKKGLILGGDDNPWLGNTLGAALVELDRCKEAITYLENAKKSLAKISVQDFGEAYSGDSPGLWSDGKNQMQNTIEENLVICKKPK